MKELTQFFKLLSDETRLRILILLYHKKLCVCELCGIMNETQPKVSKHLAKLRDLGLIKDERQERFIFYSLNIKEPFYHHFIKVIVDAKDQYPLIKADLEKVQDAEQYLIK